VILAAVVVEGADYCLLESFEPTCPPGSVILMLSAHYGRMRVGRCLSRDYYVGCSADVITQMDRRCSGKERCRVSVPEPTLLKATPCPTDLVAYLEADYTCVKGIARQLPFLINYWFTLNHRNGRGWWRGTVVERLSLASELSLSCA